MSCQCFDFNVTAGCSFLTYLNIQNSDGTYINTSGYSARSHVKSQFGDTGYLYNLNPQVIEPKISGLIMLSGGAASTQLLPAGNFYYDVELFNSGDYCLKVLEGNFNVFPTTTNF